MLNVCYTLIKGVWHMKKIEIPKELLNDLYVSRRMSAQAIAQELGVSRQTIINKLNDYNIKVRPRNPKVKKKKALNKVALYKKKDVFESKYKELKTLQLVAEYFNINLKTAFKWKEKHGIETIKDLSDKAKRTKNVGKPYANREVLEDMYSKYSTYELAQMWNCDASTIQKWLKRLDIPTRTTSEQWEHKSKNGKVPIANDKFNLKDYMSVYNEEAPIHKNLTTKIKEIVGECQSCGVRDVLDLHHINENPKDNRPSNHIILCPNCHARIHRLGKTIEELCPNYISWDKLM